MIVTVTNRKGGVGKSTMAIHIAAGLALKGYRVGLVDTDSQGNGTLMLGMQKEDGLFYLLVEKQPLEQVARHVPIENFGAVDTPGYLMLIPSAEKTFRIPYLLEDDDGFLFLETMEHFGDTYQLDYIIIDTNPSLSLFDGSIYLASDAFIYVTECEHLSLDGIQSAYRQMQKFGAQRRKYLHRPDSRLIGIIPNKYRANTVIHEVNLKELRNVFFQMVWEPIVLRTLWTEASTLRQPVFMAFPDSLAAQEARQMINRTEQELRLWQTHAEIK